MAPGPPTTPHEHHVCSVIVPTRGRPCLQNSLDALRDQSRLPDELIVITDTERRGVSWARNEGIRRSTGDIIAFTDDDCLPPPDWLARLVDAIDRHNAAGAGGTYVEIDPLLNDLRLRRNFPTTEQIDTYGHVMVGGNVAYRRSWLDRIESEDGHVFNAEFIVSQDMELALRIRKAGGVLVYVPVYVKHMRTVTPWSFLRLQFTRGIGIALLYSIQRTLPTSVKPQESLIWGQKGSRSGARWGKALILKTLGPFDTTGFSRASHFLLYWLGEKAQSIGFVWWIVRMRLKPFLPGLSGRPPVSRE